MSVSTGKASNLTKDDRTIVTQSEAVVPANAFGDKTIGMASGFMLLVNNLTGPGLVEMPGVNSSGGWFMTALILFICWIACAFSSTMLLEAMKRVPGNSKFEQRIEFTTLAKYHFVGALKPLYYATLGMFLLTFLINLVTSVIESAQTMDAALIEIFGKSCALQFHNNETASVEISGSLGFECVGKGNDGSQDSPFGANAYVLSVGYIVVLLIALPLGYWNLDDNIWVQNLAFVGLSFIVVEWCIQAIITGIDFSENHVPFVGSDQSSLYAVVLFNYAFVVTIPSWANEKKVGVNINKSVWWSTLCGTAMFFFTGIFIAGAWDCSGSNSDLLAKFTNSSTHGVSPLTKALAYLFPVIALVTGIPIFSIIVRYNLLENNICGTFWANFWGAIFPWIAAIFLYTGNALNDTVVWAGLLTIVPLNFVLPAWFYIQALKEDENDGCSLDSDGNRIETEESGLLCNGESTSVVNTSRKWKVDDEVDAWIPGHQWLQAVVTTVEPVENESTYTVTDIDGVVREGIAQTNIRERSYKPTFGPHAGDTREVVAEDESEPSSPTQKIVRSHLNDLQNQLDRYEQEIERLREEINTFIVYFPGDDEQQKMKRILQQELKRLQKKVDLTIKDMDEAKAGNMTLTPAQRDELFSALPFKYSTKTKVGIAWSIIVITTIINFIALGYEISDLA
eukprot:TRINITY_DN4826_c0_g4_i1.p1 TRINITY_DN4826_c0_g4~~TRINITY_DN4826_c0_g4_i1.p1  ORF type:complete len:680 (+),score=135.32 TRINITY_DN4826_c0_g4_i1:85-2124(+)